MRIKLFYISTDYYEYTHLLSLFQNMKPLLAASFPPHITGTSLMLTKPDNQTVLQTYQIKFKLVITTVFTRVLVDPVYKSTPNFWGQKLDFLNFQVRVSWKTYLVFLRIFFQLLRICEQITASFNVKFLLWHVYKRFTQFSNMCIRRHYDHNFCKCLQNQTWWFQGRLIHGQIR